MYIYTYAIVNIFLNPFLPLSEKLSKNPCSFEPISSFLAASFFCYGFGFNSKKCNFGLEFLVLDYSFLY